MIFFKTACQAFTYLLKIWLYATCEAPEDLNMYIKNNFKNKHWGFTCEVLKLYNFIV